MDSNELRFLENLDEHVENGLTYSRIMELVSEVWKKADPDSARLPGRRVCENPDPEPELTILVCLDSQGEPAVKISLAGKSVVVGTFRARGISSEILMTCESAETEACIRRFFARAHDQNLARNIVTKLIPYLNRFRLENLNSWADKLMEKMQEVLPSPK